MRSFDLSVPPSREAGGMFLQPGVAWLGLLVFAKTQQGLGGRREQFLAAVDDDRANEFGHVHGKAARVPDSTSRKITVSGRILTRTEA